MRTGAIVLAGGQSSRMGVDKALLDRDGVPFVTHIVTVARRCVEGGPVAVAAGANQMLPPLPSDVVVVRDAVPGRGPLQGLADGLAAVGGRVEAVLVLATDVPLVLPELGRTLIGLLDEQFDVVVPVAHGHRHPLTAVYRAGLGPLVESLLAEGSGKAGLLFERCRVRFVNEEELLSDARLAAADPELTSLLNINTVEELEHARELWTGQRDDVR